MAPEIAAARLGVLAVCIGPRALRLKDRDRDLVPIDVMKRSCRQSENRAVEVQVDNRVKGENADGIISLPRLEAVICIVGDKLVSLDASSALIVARHHHAPRKARVGVPDLVLREEPAGMVGPEQVAEAGTRVGGRNGLSWHIVLYVSLPKAVVGRMSVQDATCRGGMDEVGRRQVREGGINQLSGQGNKTGRWVNFCMGM